MHLLAKTAQESKSRGWKRVGQRLDKASSPRSAAAANPVAQQRNSGSTFFSLDRNLRKLFTVRLAV